MVCAARAGGAPAKLEPKLGTVCLLCECVLLDLVLCSIVSVLLLLLLLLLMLGLIVTVLFHPNFSSRAPCQVPLRQLSLRLQKLRKPRS